MRSRSLKGIKGATNRHVIFTIRRRGREFYYHATKGWKSRRA